MMSSVMKASYSTNLDLEKGNVVSHLSEFEGDRGTCYIGKCLF